MWLVVVLKVGSCGLSCLFQGQLSEFNPAKNTEHQLQQIFDSSGTVQLICPGFGPTCLFVGKGKLIDQYKLNLSFSDQMYRIDNPTEIERNNGTRPAIVHYPCSGPLYGNPVYLILPFHDFPPQTSNRQLYHTFNNALVSEIRSRWITMPRRRKPTSV